jgi:hypothetical protein
MTFTNHSSSALYHSWKHNISQLLRRRIQFFINSRCQLSYKAEKVAFKPKHEPDTNEHANVGKVI